MEMKAGGCLDTNTELKNPEPALDRAFACDGPVLVDVATARQELVLPPRIQLDQAKGFSLFLLKAIINGRGDEVAELVRTSLRR